MRICIRETEQIVGGIFGSNKEVVPEE